MSHLSVTHTDTGQSNLCNNAGLHGMVRLIGKHCTEEFSMVLHVYFGLGVIHSPWIKSPQSNESYSSLTFDCYISAYFVFWC